MYRELSRLYILNEKYCIEVITYNFKTVYFFIEIIKNGTVDARDLTL